MKHIFKLALVVVTTVVYSCNSASKKQTVDSVPKKPNSQPSVVQSENPESVEEQPIDTKLVFPKFIVKLHNFGVFGGHGVDGITDSSQVIINTDKNKNWSLTAKTDTIGLQAYDFYNIMELIPEDKTDKFKISYSTEVFIYEPNDNKGIKLSVMRDYKLLKDSSNYFFKVPESVSDNYNLDEVRKKVDEVKKKLKLKDTIIKDKDNNNIWYPGLTVSYQNKVCYIHPEDRIFLKIERFNGNKLIDTKFLTIKLIQGEDAD